MIFYFSGTGNSRHAAYALAGENEEVRNIADCLQLSEEFGPENLCCDIARNEAVGIVCPVYFGDLPLMVMDFMKRIRFQNQPSYLYAVFTCGEFSGLCQEKAEELLRQNGQRLDASWEVPMVPNYAVMYEIPSEEEQERILTQAERVLEEIRGEIAEHKIHRIIVSAEGRQLAEQMTPLYREAVKTHKFWINYTCVGCGLCASRCPVRAIVMRDGYPCWNASVCQHCMSCVRCGAVQYGVTTYGRKRYKHPDLRSRKTADKETRCH